MYSNDPVCHLASEEERIMADSMASRLRVSSGVYD